MARILVMPDGNWLSHVSRPLAVAKALREDGHDVSFAGDGQYLELAREAGFAVSFATTMDPEHVMACSRSGRVNWFDDARLAAYFESDLEAFERERPDLVLGDFRLSLGLSTAVAGIAHASILNASWTNYYTARHDAPEHLAVTRVVGRALATRFVPLIKALIISFDARPFRRLARRLGLAPPRNIWDAWCGDLNLMVDTPEYGPTADLPANFHYIGPIVWEPEVAAPRWLADLDPERPVVYLTMGSTGYGRFFQEAVDLFGGTEVQLIMTTAGLAELGELPPNCFAAELAPGSRLMEVSDVVVCQGGNGTIYQALSHGVPIVGIPTMHDQEFNLDRVVDLGVGVELSELRFRPSHLRDAVARVADPSFHARAREQAARLEGYDAPRTGARLIGELVERRAAAIAEV